MCCTSWDEGSVFSSHTICSLQSELLRYSAAISSTAFHISYLSLTILWLQVMEMLSLQTVNLSLKKKYNWSIPVL